MYVCLFLAHYKEKWDDQQAMYIGLRYPEDRKKRKHRSKKSSKGASIDEKDEQTGPGNSKVTWRLSIVTVVMVNENTSAVTDAWVEPIGR